MPTAVPTNPGNKGWVRVVRPPLFYCHHDHFLSTADGLSATLRQQAPEAAPSSPRWLVPNPALLSFWAQAPRGKPEDTSHGLLPQLPYPTISLHKSCPQGWDQRIRVMNLKKAELILTCCLRSR